MTFSACSVTLEGYKPPYSCWEFWLCHGTQEYTQLLYWFLNYLSQDQSSPNCRYLTNTLLYKIWLKNFLQRRNNISLCLNGLLAHAQKTKQIEYFSRARQSWRKNLMCWRWFGTTDCWRVKWLAYSLPTKPNLLSYLHIRCCLTPKQKVRR